MSEVTSPPAESCTEKHHVCKHETEQSHFDIYTQIFGYLLLQIESDVETLLVECTRMFCLATEIGFVCFLT